MREVRLASSPECKAMVAEGAELQKTWRSLVNQKQFCSRLSHRVMCLNPMKKALVCHWTLHKEAARQSLAILLSLAQFPSLAQPPAWDGHISCCSSAAIARKGDLWGKISNLDFWLVELLTALEGMAVNSCKATFCSARRGVRRMSGNRNFPAGQAQPQTSQPHP